MLTAHVIVGAVIEAFYCWEKGMVGDVRRYEWVIAPRAVETIDFMTARWAHLPYELLE